MPAPLSDPGVAQTAFRVGAGRSGITGRGVTAGIDFGLKLAAALTSPLYAQAIQLYLEYAPAPPYDSGHPKSAPAEAREFLESMFAGLRTSMTTISRRVHAGAA